MYSDDHPDPLDGLPDPDTRSYASKSGLSIMKSTKPAAEKDSWDSISSSQLISQGNDIPQFNFRLFVQDKVQQRSPVSSPNKLKPAASFPTSPTHCTTANPAKEKEKANPYDFNDFDDVQPLNKAVVSRCVVPKNGQRVYGRPVKTAIAPEKSQKSCTETERRDGESSASNGHSSHPLPTKKTNVYGKRPAENTQHNGPNQPHKKPCSPDKLLDQKSGSSSQSSSSIPPLQKAKSASGVSSSSNGPSTSHPSSSNLPHSTSTRAHSPDLSASTESPRDVISRLLSQLDRSKNTHSVRCSATLQLAKKLIDPIFRMSFFTNGSLEIYDLLSDAARDPRLSVCFAVLLLMLSTDRMKTDLNEDALEIIGSLLSGSGEVEECRDASLRDKAFDIVGKSRFVGEFSKTDITARTLVLEALTTMKLGTKLRWFTTEIRTRGLLSHLAEHFQRVCSQLEKDACRGNLNSLIRTVEFFIKICHDDPLSMEYLISTPGEKTFDVLVRLMRFLMRTLREEPASQGEPIRLKEVLLLRTCLTWLLNITCHMRDSRDQLGETSGLISDLAQCCLQSFLQIPRDKMQEVFMRALLCLVNLTFESAANCALFIQLHPDKKDTGKSALGSMLERMKSFNEAAISSTDALDRCTEKLVQKSRGQPFREGDLDTTIADVLDKAGENMEHFVNICNIGILIAHLVSNNQDARENLGDCLERNFSSKEEGIEIATNAISRVIDFVSEAQIDKMHPVSEMHAAVDILESYKHS